MVVTCALAHSVFPRAVRRMQRTDLREPSRTGCEASRAGCEASRAWIRASPAGGGVELDPLLATAGVGPRSSRLFRRGHTSTYVINRPLGRVRSFRVSGRASLGNRDRGSIRGIPERECAVVRLLLPKALRRSRAQIKGGAATRR